MGNYFIPLVTLFSSPTHTSHTLSPLHNHVKVKCNIFLVLHLSLPNTDSDTESPLVVFSAYVLKAVVINN